MYTAAPGRYAIRLEPNLTNLTFDGHVTIDFVPRPPAGEAGILEVILDAVDLDVRSVTLTHDGSTEVAAYRQDAGLLRVDPGRTVAGPFSLMIDYRGEINDMMAGFYRSRYTQDGVERYFAVTQFEERDARRAFPCVDHPAYKAVFEVEIVTEPGHIAIANTPELPGDGTVHRFEPTPPMSTYLVFFGVGPFDCLEDRSWRVPIRVAVSPGKAQYARAALEYGRKSLAFLEEYTGIPYPLGKMDLIGVSDFAFGAMENFGAITYRENYVLTYPDSTTRRDIERMMGIAAHEVAHMWFGDLVSPADWRYVWLNEAFATYFGNVVVEHYYPQWRTMDQMLLGGTSGSMDRDALAHTIPIEFADGEELDIDASTAPIVYTKGASILAMVRGFYGDDVFRDATNRFLSAYSFACADTEQFLDAFTAALGTDTRRMLTGWIRQPGFPVISVRREGSAVVLEQRRFCLNGADESQQGLWEVPVTGLVAGDEPGSDGSFRLWLADERATAAADGAWIKLNAGCQGYYRVFYEDPADWARLGEAAARGELGARDRYGLVSDLDAFVRAGIIPLARYIDYLESYYREESEFLVLSAIASSLADFHDLLGADERVASCGRLILGRLAPGLLQDPTHEEPYDNVLLRDQVLGALASFGDEAVSGRCLDLMRAIRAGKPVHPDLVPVTLRCAAAADASLVPWIREELVRETTTESRKAHLLAALGAVRDPATAEEVLEYSFASVPYRNRLFFLRVAASNPAFRPHLWPWLERHFGDLQGIHSYHLGGTIALIAPYGGLGREENVARFLESYRETDPPVGGGVLDLALDRLALNSRLVGETAAQK